MLLNREHQNRKIGLCQKDMGHARRVVEEDSDIVKNMKPTMRSVIQKWTVAGVTELVFGEGPFHLVARIRKTKVFFTKKART